jgi:hypothetical protein
MSMTGRAFVRSTARHAPFRIRTTAAITGRTLASISAWLRLAIGWGIMTGWKSGRPYMSAIARAGARNASVQIDTAGTPARSSTIPSAKLAAEQEPQSPTPAITASQACAISLARFSSTGVPKYDFV